MYDDRLLCLFLQFSQLIFVTIVYHTILFHHTCGSN